MSLIEKKGKIAMIAIFANVFLVGEKIIIGFF